MSSEVKLHYEGAEPTRPLAPGNRPEPIESEKVIFLIWETYKKKRNSSICYSNFIYISFSYFLHSSFDLYSFLSVSCEMFSSIKMIEFARPNQFLQFAPHLILIASASIRARYLFSYRMKNKIFNEICHNFLCSKKWMSFAILLHSPVPISSSEICARKQTTISNHKRICR